MNEPKEIKILKSDEEEALDALQGTVKPMIEFRETGKRAISFLAVHVKEKHEGYMSIKDKEELHLMLEFLGIPVLVRAEIPLIVLPSPSDSEKGKITAYLLIEKEKEEDKPKEFLRSITFSKSGNFNGDLRIENFSLCFVKQLVDELIKRKELMR